jgi:dUTP pyrophosphatase
MDLRANLSESVTLAPLGRTVIKTGLFIELPITKKYAQEAD